VAPPGRERLSIAERSAVVITIGSLVIFGTYGFSRHEPSTAAYLVSVIALGAGIAFVRRRPLRGWLALALAGLAAGHLAGGLVTVGNDVLYNAHPSIRIFQYDHVFHATASGVATIVLWTFVASELDAMVGAIVLSGLGALGVGAINEVIEFLATLAHHGRHVGGYHNTGWDLISNMVGALTASLVLGCFAERHPDR